MVVPSSRDQVARSAGSSPSSRRRLVQRDRESRSRCPSPPRCARPRRRFPSPGSLSRQEAAPRSEPHWPRPGSRRLLAVGVDGEDANGWAQRHLALEGTRVASGSRSSSHAPRPAEIRPDSQVLQAVEQLAVVAARHPPPRVARQLLAVKRSASGGRSRPAETSSPPRAHSAGAFLEPLERRAETTLELGAASSRMFAHARTPRWATPAQATAPVSIGCLAGTSTTERRRALWPEPWGSSPAASRRSTSSLRPGGRRRRVGPATEAPWRSTSLPRRSPADPPLSPLGAR